MLHLSEVNFRGMRSMRGYIIRQQYALSMRGTKGGAPAPHSCCTHYTSYHSTTIISISNMPVCELQTVVLAHTTQLHCNCPMSVHEYLDEYNCDTSTCTTTYLMGVLEFMYSSIAILYMHSYINAIIGKVYTQKCCNHMS